MNLMLADGIIFYPNIDGKEKIIYFDSAGESPDRPFPVVFSSPVLLGGWRMKLDQTNLSLLRELRNGRVSYKEMGERLGLSEATVRTRVSRMIADGLLDISGRADVDALPGQTLAFVAVKLSSPDLIVRGELFSALKGVISVAVVTGRFDLLLTVLLNESFDLLRFYTEEFSKCSEQVRSVETFVVYKGFNLKVPYIL